MLNKIEKKKKKIEVSHVVTFGNRSWNVYVLIERPRDIVTHFNSFFLSNIVYCPGLFGCF
jgi:hypothetical protein